MNIITKLKRTSPKIRNNTKRWMLQMLFFNLLIILLLILSAGTMTRQYSTVMVLIQLTNVFFLLLNMPAELGI